MIHHSIRKPKSELISIDEPGTFDRQCQTPSRQLERTPITSRSKIVKLEFLYQQPPTIRLNHLQKTWHPTPTSTCTQPEVRQCHKLIIVNWCSSYCWFPGWQAKEKETSSRHRPRILANISIEQPPTATRFPSPSRNWACSTMYTSWS